MRNPARPRFLLTTMFMAVLVTGCAVSETSMQAVGIDDPPQKQLESLMWILTGSWAGMNEERLWEAHYTSPAGGLLIGTTKRYDKSVIDFYQFETFQVEDGKLTVKPYLNGSSTVVFTLKSLDPEKRRAVFERPDHEPRNIEYWRMNEDTLAISVTTPIPNSSVDGGKPKVKGMRIGLSRLQ